LRRSGLPQVRAYDNVVDGVSLLNLTTFRT
jgi:hypothetical protein